MLVPATARLIQIPLVIPKWKQALQTYPVKSLAAYFLIGITSILASMSVTTILVNLEGALLHPEVVKDYLAAEVLSH